MDEGMGGVVCARCQVRYEGEAVAAEFFRNRAGVVLSPCRECLRTRGAEERAMTGAEALRRLCLGCERWFPLGEIPPAGRLVWRTGPIRCADCLARRQRDPAFRADFDQVRNHWRGDEGALTVPQWGALKEAAGGVCAYCHRPPESRGGRARRLVVEHLTPVERGGGQDVTNVVPACEGCNSAKGRRTPLEWFCASLETERRWHEWWRRDRPLVAPEDYPTPCRWRVA